MSRDRLRPGFTLVELLVRLSSVKPRIDLTKDLKTKDSYPHAKIKSIP